MNQLAIQTNHLTRAFGPRLAVNDLNIGIRQREIFSLLGTNGAGKTTTIRMLCCLLQPTSGEAFVMNHSILNNNLDIKRIIGVSPQETAIAGHLNTRENLQLMGSVFGFSREESRKRATNLMELMELEDRKDLAKKLSGGLQRRLSIAMALISDPQILFLDEPTLGLDPHARKSVWNYIEKLKKEKTILLTTHYLEEADALSDHIAIMDKGVIVASGTSHELKQQHKSHQTILIWAENISADVVEQLNKLDMIITAKGDSLEIKANDPDIYVITDILRSKQVKITGINMQEPTLDDVFLALTGKEGVL